MALMSFGMAEGLSYNYKADKDLAYFSAQIKAKNDANKKAMEEANKELNKLSELNGKLKIKSNVEAFQSEVDKTIADVGKISLDPRLGDIEKQTYIARRVSETRNNPIFGKDELEWKNWENVQKDKADGRLNDDNVYNAVKAKWEANWNDGLGFDYDRQPENKAMETYIKRIQTLQGDPYVGSQRDYSVPNHVGIFQGQKVSRKDIEREAMNMINDPTWSGMMEKDYEKAKAESGDNEFFPKTQMDWMVSIADAHAKAKGSYQWISTADGGKGAFVANTPNRIQSELLSEKNMGLDKDNTYKPNDNVKHFIPQNKDGIVPKGTLIRIPLGEGQWYDLVAPEAGIKVVGAVGATWANRKAGDMDILGRFVIPPSLLAGRHTGMFLNSKGQMQEFTEANPAGYEEIRRTAQAYNRKFKKSNASDGKSADYLEAHVAGNVLDSDGMSGYESIGSKRNVTKENITATEQFQQGLAQQGDYIDPASVINKKLVPYKPKGSTSTPKGVGGVQIVVPKSLVK